jgi:hypothetical protein
VDRHFHFDELFIRVHNETLSVVAVRVRDKDCSLARVHCCDAAPTPTGFAEIVSDDRKRLRFLNAK